MKSGILFDSEGYRMPIPSVSANYNKTGAGVATPDPDGCAAGGGFNMEIILLFWWIFLDNLSYPQNYPLTKDEILLLARAIYEYTKSNITAVTFYILY